MIEVGEREFTRKHMALTESQQVLETIKRSSKPLIVVPHGGGADGYASALGLTQVIKKLNKDADIVAVNGTAPKNLKFLEGHDTVGTSLEQLRKLVIEVDTSKTSLRDITHEKTDDKFLISILPDQGFWDEKDIRVVTGGYRYDLIICIGAKDLEACAHFYESFPDFFFRTPIINIDHSPANEHFGQINIVDMTASACGEVCHDLIASIETSLLDEHSATAFLAGMIAKTKSFKATNVTPKTLHTASQLIGHGAKREEIVQHLYRTRSVPTLRLWGRALARLKHDASANLVWTMLSQQDFMHAGAEEDDLPDMINELISSSPDAKLILILYEDHERNICGILHAEHPYDALEIASPFKPGGTRQEIRMCFTGKNLVQVEKEVVKRIVER